LVGKIFVREHLQSGELHFRPVVNPEMKRTLYLVRRANDLPTHLNETMRQLIRELITAEIQNGGWDATPL